MSWSSWARAARATCPLAGRSDLLKADADALDREVEALE
jgi:hypothetical protein